MLINLKSKICNYSPPKIKTKLLFSFPKKYLKGEEYENKTIKWYWRGIEYDMLLDKNYKGYSIKENISNGNLEFIPRSRETNKYDSCLIWLYDGDHIEYFIEHLLEFNNFPPKNYKILFVKAPINPITHDTVVLERSWFNIFDLPDASGSRVIKKNQIDDFNKSIHLEILNQYNLIGNYKNIFLGGFSQSACMALYSTMTFNKNIGGCIALSGFNFDFTPLDKEKKNIPLLCINGEKDEVVISRHAKNSYGNYIKLGFNINYILEPGLYHFFSKSGLNKANNLLEKSLVKN